MENETKSKLAVLLGREPSCEVTKNGRFIVKYVDFNNPHPSKLVADTEELAYQALLEYLKSKEIQNDGRGDPQS